MDALRFTASDGVVDSSRRLWRSALSLIHNGDKDATQIQAAAALLTLARWRVHASRSEDLVCSFVAACAVRMVILDASAPFMSEVVTCSLETASAVRDERVRTVLLSDTAELAPFEPPSSLDEPLREVLAASRCWNDGKNVCWARVAYAVCFSEFEEKEDDETPVTMELNDLALETLTQFDADCLHRRFLQVLLAPAVTAPEDPRAVAVVDWVVRSTRAANDEVFAMAREAITWCFQTPKTVRRGQGAWSRRLTEWDPEHAVVAHAASRPGFDTLKDETGDAFFKDSLVLHFFDYCMRQRYDLPFVDLFFVSDYTSDATIQSLDAFKSEKMKRPPPKLVHCAKSWYLVYRSDSPGGFSKIVRHSSCASALLGWLQFIEDVRGGVVFMSKRTSNLFAEMVAPAPELNRSILVGLDDIGPRAS